MGILSFFGEATRYVGLVFGAEGDAAVPVTAANPLPVTGPSGAGSNQVQGTAADGAAAVGSPVQVAGKDGSGNIQSLLTDTAGRQIVDGSYTEGGAAAASGVGIILRGATSRNARGDENGMVVQAGLSSTFWGYASVAGGIANSAVAVTIKAAAGAGVRNFLKALQIDHDTLGATTELAIRDGAAGTVLWRGKLQTTAKEGTAIVFDPPLKGTANTLMEVLTITAVTGGVFVNAQGFTGT